MNIDLALLEAQVESLANESAIVTAKIGKAANGHSNAAVLAALGEIAGAVFAKFTAEAREDSIKDWIDLIRAHIADDTGDKDGVNKYLKS